MLNFSNIRLGQQIHFLYNPFLIHPAIQNATQLFEQLSKKKGPSISQEQLWLFDTLRTKKSSHVVWFLSTSIFQHLYISYPNVWPFIFNVMLFMECQYSTFHELHTGMTIEQFKGIPRDPVFI